MRHKILVAAVAVLSVVSVATASAASKHAKRHLRHAHYPAGAVEPRSSFEPARMIEVRPGVWISSYDCISDSGYGRWAPCDGGGRK